MKMLTCECGERVRVSSDATGVRCARCVMLGKARLSEVEPMLAEVAAEVGWPKNASQRFMLAGRLAECFLRAGLGHAKPPALTGAILLSLQGQHNRVGDWVLSLCFEKGANGERRAIETVEVGTQKSGGLRGKRPSERERRRARARPERERAARSTRRRTAVPQGWPSGQV